MMQKVYKALAASLACLLIISVIWTPGAQALAQNESSPESVVQDLEQHDSQNFSKEPESPGEIGAAQPDAVVYTVRFLNWDESQLGEIQYITEGEAAIAPPVPNREGYRFTGWSAEFNNVVQDMDIVAQYEELDSYTITINYIFANNTIALQPRVYSVAEGGSFDEIISSPPIAGFQPNEASLEITLSDIQQDYVYTVVYSPAEDTPYRVQHYTQKLVLENEENPMAAENFDLADTEDLTGETAALVTAVAKSYTGFSPPAALPQAHIAADGGTLLRVFYTRNQYAVYFDAAGGSYVEPIAALYQQPIVPPEDPARPGYTFTGWSSPVPGEMPAEDLYLTAGWAVEGTVQYTYVFWLENITSTGYDYVGTSLANGQAGAAPALASGVPGGVHFPIASTRYALNSAKTNAEKPASINGDGTTIVNMYYDRNSYTLRFTFDATKYQVSAGGATYTTSPYLLTAKYGAPIDDKWPDAPTLKPGQSSTQVFVGWNGGSTNYVTTQYFLSDNHISSSPLSANWSSTGRKITVNYGFQDLTGGGYTIRHSQDVVVQSNSTTWNSKSFVGFTARQSQVSIPSNGIVNFTYTRNAYSVTYYNAGVIDKTTENVLYETPISDFGYTPERPTSVPRDYVFGGWYTTPQGFDGSEYDFADKTMPAYNLIVYAHWVRPQYTATFDPANGEESFTQTVYALENLAEPAPPTRPGYVFGGWYRTGMGLKYVFSFPVNTNLTLTARWVAENNITYDVVYIKDGEEFQRDSYGGGSVGDSVTGYAITVPGYLPDALSKSLTLAPGGNEIVFTYTPFTSVGYTVRYVDQNGIPLRDDKTGSSSQASVTENYVNLSGYYPNYYQQTLLLTPDAAANIITFVYTPNEPARYLVRTFMENTNGGYTVTDEEKTAPAGSLAQEQPASIEGFTFQPQLSATSRVVASDDSTVLRLYYNRNQFTIGFVAEGNGTLTGETSFEAIRYQTTFGAALTVPTPKEDPGYMFTGWTPSLPGSASEIIQDDTYTAHFERDDSQWATVTLVGNGADNNGSLVSEEMLVGSTYTLPANPYTRLDYHFVGWDEAPDGTGASYADGEAIPVPGNVVLYAQWVENEKYVVTYLNNGGTGTVSDTTLYEAGDEVTVLPNGFTYPGNRFTGWLSANGIPYSPNDTFDIYENTALSAQWERDPSQWAAIVYDKNSAEATGDMPDEELLVNAPHTLAPNGFTRPNHSFAGWGIEPDGSVVYADRAAYTATDSGSVTLYAQWLEDEKFDITYHSNTLVPEHRDDIGVYASIPHTIFGADTFTYENHDFVRWSEYPDGSGATYLPGSEVYISQNMDLYAFWLARRLYKVTYRDGFAGESVVREDYADADGFLDFEVEDNMFRRYGYDFTSWLSDTSAIAYPRAVILDMSDDIAFTAQWQPTPYIIEYDLDGGTVNGVNPTRYDIETPTFTLVNPDKPGYTFLGWTGSGLESASAEVTIAQSRTGNLRFTAHWQPTPYTIQYDLDGGTVSGVNPTGYTIETPAFTLVNPVKPGYTFTGWTGSGLETATTEVTIAPPRTGDLSFTAQWQPTPYTIEYDLDGGTVNGVNPTGYNIETPAFTLVNPVKPGYTFTGWTGSGLESATTGVTIAPPRTGNLRFTAHWQPIPYTIEYDLDGGTVNGVNPTGYTIETPAFTLVNPVKPGYTFTGWTGSGLETATTEVTIAPPRTGDLSFTAQWQPTPYTIEYDLDGGTVNGVNPTGYNIETPAFTLVNPVKPGYTFTGWTGSGLETATIGVTIAPPRTGNLQFTAHWQRDDSQWVTISFVSEDESKGTLQGTLRYEGIIGEEIALARLVAVAYPTPAPAEGYQFDRWSDGIPLRFPGESMVITAYWAPLAVTPSTPSGVNPSTDPGVDPSTNPSSPVTDPSSPATGPSSPGAGSGSSGAISSGGGTGSGSLGVSSSGGSPASRNGSGSSAPGAAVAGTGDTGRPWLYIPIAAFAVLCTALLVFMGRKRKHSNK